MPSDFRRPMDQLGIAIVLALFEAAFGIRATVGRMTADIDGMAAVELAPQIPNLPVRRGRSLVFGITGTYGSKKATCAPRGRHYKTLAR